MMQLSERLTLARERCGLSQTQVALKLDISRSTLWRWETGETIPELDQFKPLSLLYGVSECWLAFGVLNTNVSQDFTPLLAGKVGQARKDLQDIVDLLSTLPVDENND